MDTGIYKKSNVAVIGCEELLRSFKVLGVDVYVTSVDRLEFVIDSVIEDGYNIIFVTEEVVDRLGERLKEIALSSPVGISVIPTLKRKGGSVDWIRDVVRKGLGVDIDLSKPKTQD